MKYNAMFGITEEQWESYYKLYMKLNVSNKAKENQYKIVHDYVATNKLLYKMNVRDSARCNFCNLYTQDTCHLFYECLEVRNFWFRLQEWVYQEYNESLSMAVEDILFGNVNASELENRILLYAKLYIFKSKYKDSIPSFNLFLLWVSKHVDIY